MRISFLQFLFLFFLGLLFFADLPQLIKGVKQKIKAYIKKPQ
uniref:Uncharacterized protein ORF41 n=21 Tax=Laminariales TaxID=2886 RepID=F8UWL1_9PHAE|nr:hypothetical protein SajaoM_p08 [Saccharina japonica]YP_003288933.1 hypothetical protein SareoM_p08 [Saccharina religiosa]YP_003288971.1 hypothetical protein SaocoM_p08 [Saccharina ochotensis]YP_003289048.1 hypothetical protein SadioM_p08 [Saccharina diabolica]YP_003289099.1 hypothetical protein SalooM_p08 [Saccharina longipedalis]YP_004598995.1 hypothetical protein SajaxlaM_p08 [Saccharina japonica x Saccharina latissima]YP_008145572.1 hypothetical protein M930_p31 [Laminaria hyperborea]